MKLAFKNIHIENFLSFKLADIDLSRPGYTSVIGINDNALDGASSNGAGKTAIFEAINWCLCGETIRGTKEVKNCYTNDGALVELEFLADDKKYKLIRTKEHSKYKTNLKIFIDNEDKSGKGIRDGEKLLEQYLPDVNSSLIGSVIILGQGLPQRFTNNTPSGRKEVLETLSKSDFMIKDLKDRIVIRKDILSDKVRQYEDEILRLQTKKSLLQTQLNDKDSELKNLECFDSTAEQDRIKYLKEKILEYQEDIERNNKIIEDSQKEQDQLTNIITDLSIKQVEESDNAKKEFDISSLMQKKAEISSQIKMLESEIKTLESVTDICPTCGQKLPDVHKIDTTEKHKECDNLIEEFNVVCKDFDNLNQKLQQRLDKIKQTFTSESTAINERLSYLRKYILDNKSVIQEEEGYINSYLCEKNNIQNAIDTWQSKVDSCKDFIEKHKLDLAEIEENILYNNIELDKTKEHLDVINKFYSVITRDFRGYLLSNIISFIDSRAKKYSEQLFDNNLFEFKLEGNNISIYHANRQYENLSGGERQKVDIIVQLALRDMLCKYLNFSSNILVMDELTDNLDSRGCDKLFNLISSNLDDVESIYIISHHSDYSLPIDNELVVRKGEDGISYIE